MSQRSKQAGMITGTEFFRFGAKTLIGMALARILLPAELGTYRQLFLIYTTLSTLMLLGIPQSLLYFLPKIDDVQEQKRHIGKILNITGMMALLFSILLLIGKGMIANVFNNPQLSTLLVIYAIYPLFMFVTQIFNYAMLGMNRAASAARFTMVSVLTDLICVLGAAFFFRDLGAIVSAVVIAAFLQWLYARIQLCGYKGGYAFDRAFLKQQFAYSLPLGLSAIIGMLSIQLDKLVISGFFTPEQFAVFSIGAMELPFVAIFNNSVNAVLLPGISGQNDRETFCQIFKGAVRKNALIIFPLTALFLLFSRPIIVFLYSARYLAAIPYFQVYLAILPLRIATFGVVFLAMGKTRYILYNSIITLSANLILNLILIRYMGMMGAALATVIVTWLAVGVYLYWLKYKLSFRLRDLAGIKPIFTTALSTIVAGASAYLAMRYIPNMLLSYAAGATCFAVVYYVAGRLTGAILPYDIQLAKSFVTGIIRRTKA